MPSTSQPLTSRQELDALLQGSRWTGTITYGFPDSPSDFPAGYGDEPTKGFFAVSSYQQDTVRYALGLLQSYTNLTFRAVGAGDADIAFGQTSLAATAYASSPDSSRGGDVWFGNDFRNPRVGDYAFATHLHEIGHALGLKHPHEGSDTNSTLMPAQYDWLGYTVMSYRDHINGPLQYSLPQFHYPTTYMALDILALQTMYGADYGTQSGDTVYTWSATTGQQFINGAAQALPGSGSGFAGDGASNYVFMTVWDGGGTDTYDFSNYAPVNGAGLSISLAPGGLNYLPNGYVENSFTFQDDPRSLIENAIGSSGSDTIIGNLADNTIDGRLGSDTIDGGAGNDYLLGREGDDRLSGGAGRDTLVGGTGYNRLRGGAGADTASFTFNFLDAMIRFLPDGTIYVGTADGFSIVNSVENLRFADGSVRVADLRPVDRVAPTAVIPNDNEVVTPPGQALADNTSFTLRFSEDVSPGSGQVRIYFSDGALYKSYAVADLFTGGDVLSVPAPADQGQYYIKIDKGALVDAAGNPFAGITDAHAWNFFVGVKADDFSDGTLGTGTLTVDGKATTGYLSDRYDSDAFQATVTPGQMYEVRLTASGLDGAVNAMLSNGSVAGESFFFLAQSSQFNVGVRNGNLIGPFAGNYSVSIRTVTDDFAADATTTGRLAVGRPVQGIIQGTADKDWIRVDLVAGQTYRFTLEGGATSKAGMQDAHFLTMTLGRQEAGFVSNPLPGTAYGTGGYGSLMYASTGHAVQATFTADRTDTYYMVIEDRTTASGTYTSETGGTYTLKVDSPAATEGPHLVSFTPGDGAVMFDTTSNIVLTFDAAVLAGEGKVRVVYNSGFFLNRDLLFDVNDSEHVRISGNVVTINPDQAMPAGRWTVSFDPSALVGQNGTFADKGALNGQFAVGYNGSGNNIGIFDDYANDPLTFGRIDVGGSINGELHLYNWSNTRAEGAGFDNAKDSDWFRINLSAGETYDLRLIIGDGQQMPNSNTDIRPMDLAVHDAQGNLLAADTANAGGGLNSRLLFTAPDDGVYFISVDSGEGYPRLTTPYTLEVGTPLGGRYDGTARNDTLTGTPGNDTLNGRAGADRMIGKGGSDLYYIDNPGDLVAEKQGGGVDTIRSTIGLALPDNVEKLVLAGTDPLNGTGNALDNAITGNGAANTIDGGAGADVMAGGGGDDTYFADNAGDVVIETSRGGVDVVRSSVSFQLGAGVEKLALTGPNAIDGTGNALGNALRGNDADNALRGLAGDDVLYGQGGNDTLDGGRGADTMVGGAGDDLYRVDNAGDRVTEKPGEGNDTVVASLSWTLSGDVEQLALGGTGSIAATGNDLDNVLIGNAGANVLTGLLGNDRLVGNAGDDTLIGGAGADRMEGGTGNDIYLVGSPDDITFEKPDEGIDLVKSAINWTLGDNVENIYLGGTAAIDAVGNGLANYIKGNGAANALSGGDGDDILEGGGGRDQMTGGAGIDRFVFADGDFGGSTAATADRIMDFGTGGRDVISLKAVDADTTLAGDQAFAFIGSAAFGHVAGELRYQQGAGALYVMGDTNGDGVADFWIALAGAQTLAANQLVL